MCRVITCYVIKATLHRYEYRCAPAVSWLRITEWDGAHLWETTTHITSYAM